MLTAFQFHSQWGGPPFDEDNAILLSGFALQSNLCLAAFFFKLNLHFQSFTWSVFYQDMIGIFVEKLHLISLLYDFIIDSSGSLCSHTDTVTVAICFSLV